jgi:hypothetical protein
MMLTFFNLSFFTCFGQKRPSSEGFLYQEVLKVPLQCHKHTISDYISCLIQTIELKPIKSNLILLTII